MQTIELKYVGTHRTMRIFDASFMAQTDYAELGIVRDDEITLRVGEGYQDNHLCDMVIDDFTINGAALPSHRNKKIRNYLADFDHTIVPFGAEYQFDE